MKKRTVILIVAIVIVTIVTTIMIIRYNNNPEVQLEKANKEIQDVTKEERYLSDSELDEILKNTGKVLLSQVNYDYTTESYNFEKKEFEPLFSGHIWSSGTNLRNDCRKTHTIVNKGIIYWGKDKFKRAPLNYDDVSVRSMHSLAINASAVEIIMYLLDTSVANKENIKYFGKEKIDGKDTVIIGGSYSPGFGDYEVKLWIWKEKGIVVKSEIMEKIEPVDQSELAYIKPTRHVYSFENISFDEFDKSIFYVSEDELVSPNRISPDEKLKNDIFKDSDNDGLIDYVEENIFNTNPNNPDSDGDGYKDGDEIENAYDPNGDGRLFGELQFKSLLP